MSKSAEIMFASFKFREEMDGKNVKVSTVTSFGYKETGDQSIDDKVHAILRKEGKSFHEQPGAITNSVTLNSECVAFVRECVTIVNAVSKDPTTEVEPYYFELKNALQIQDMTFFIVTTFKCNLRDHLIRCYKIVSAFSQPSLLYPKKKINKIK